MLAEESKLKWLGLDLRPRWRRKALVAGTFFVLFIGMDWCADHYAWSPYRCTAGWMLLLCVVEFLSPLRNHGPVKRFEDQRVLRIGSREMERVEGLDGWANYLFGVERFEAASAEQQDQILNRYRVGVWFLPAREGRNLAAPWLDEREQKERGAADRWAIKTLGGWMTLLAGQYISRAHRHKTVDPLEPAFWLVWCAMMLWLLPRARVFWTEPDPREAAGELQVV